MSEPRVSVLVPIYNVEPFLAQALDSLVEQHLQDIEIICINDGSTDASLAIVEEYAARDPRLVVIDKPNSGYGASMNMGLDRARGQYIGILEPDDYAAPQMFQRLYDLAATNQADVAKANYCTFVTAPGLSVSRVNLFPADLLRRPFRPLDEPRLFRVRPSIWAGIYATDFLRRHRIRFLETPGASYQDAGFNFKVWATAERVVLDDKAYLHYRTDNALSSVKDQGKVWAVAEEYDSITRFIADLPDAEKLRRIMQGARFESYRWNLDRLSLEVRPEFFQHVFEEYREAARVGQLDAAYFNDANWRALGQLLDDPRALEDAGYLLSPVVDVAPAPPAPVEISARTLPTVPADRLISVIIPVHNAEKYVAACLDSVLAQTHAEIEVLCVDDGSTDRTPEILRDYAAVDPRILVITQANAGAGAARNAGLERAQGAYFSFLDADDVFEPTMLERAFGVCEDKGADFCVYRSAWFEGGEVTRVHPIDHGIRQHLLPRGNRVFAPSDVQRDLFSLFQGWAWDKLYRADFVRRNGLRFQPLRTTNDLLFVFSAVALADRIAVLPETLAYQRREVLSSLSRTRERSWDNFHRALVALRETLEERALFERLRTDFANYALGLALWNLDTLEGESFHRLYESLTSNWFDELGVSDLSSEDFYRADHRAKYLQVVSSSSDEYAEAARPQAAAETPVDRLESTDGVEWDDRPELSVIVPVYNAVEFLRQCLDSVLAQSAIDLEVVCVNDGSTDASLEILREYQRAFGDRVVIIDQPNGGLSVARNSGLAVARGRYVCFLDSDDYWRPANLRRLVDWAITDELDYLGYDGVSFRDLGVSDADWDKLANYYLRSRDYDVTDGATLLARMRSHRDFRVSACLYLVRLDLLQGAGIRFIEGITHEDNPFTFEVMLTAKRAAHATVVLYARRVRPGSIMTTGSRLSSLRGYVRSFAAMARMIDQQDGVAADVAAHLGGAVYQVLFNAREQFAQLPPITEAEIVEGAESDPLAYAGARIVRHHA